MGCLAFTLESISEAHAKSLLGENARDLARVTAPALAQGNAMRATITTDVVLRLRPDITIHTDNPEDQIILWHRLALNVTAVDHTSELNAAADQINFEQYGPYRTSYALAIVHIAMFEVANAYAPPGARYKSWITYNSWITLAGGMAPPTPPSGASETAAIIGAAYTALVDLYPNLQPELQQQRDIALSQLAGWTTSRTEGESYGELIAKQIIAILANDGRSYGSRAGESTLFRCIRRDWMAFIPRVSGRSIRCPIS